VALGIAPGIVFMAGLVADAFVTPTAHQVHSPGAVQVNAVWFYSSGQAVWVQGPPSESVAVLRCEPPNGNGAAPCPHLDQSTQTLYVVGTFCGGYPKDSFPAEGQNVEYISSTRTLVVHCYSAKPLLDVHGPPGVSFEVLTVLLAVPTAAMGSGQIQIFEDDRIEHLIGDQSDDHLVATATIS
jgi:hypothetical protein